MTEQRDAVVEALFRKARVLLHASLNAAGDDAPAAKEAFEQAAAELRQWDDLSDKRFVDFRIDEMLLDGEVGQALALVNDRLDDEPLERSLYERRMELLQQLGWDHLLDAERDWMLRRFPKAYPPF
jgi:tripeptidyl-peptidase-2